MEMIIDPPAENAVIVLSERVGTFRLILGRRFTPFDYDRIHSKARPRPAAPAQVDDEDLDSIEAAIMVSGDSPAE